MESVPEIVAKTKPAVVEIVAMDQNGSPTTLGTGFFVSSDGLVVTNFHVIERATTLTAVSTNGAKFVFKSIVAHPAGVDLAILKFQAHDVPFLSLGESTKKVEGERVIVIGNPTGLFGSVSDGIISAFRENRSLIQITAPISPGSSGSPVLDESGSVIGVATLTSVEGQNLNFAIAVEKVSAALASLTDERTHAPQGSVPQTTATPYQRATASVFSDEVTQPIRRFDVPLNDDINSVAFSPDGRTIVAAGDVVRLLDVETGKEIRRYALEDQPNGADSVAFSPDGRWIAAGCHNGSVKLWDVNIGKPTTEFTGHTDIVTAVAFSPDGNLIASGGFDRTLRLWDTKTGKETNKFGRYMDVVNSLAFSPDGHCVACNGVDGTVLLWRVENQHIEDWARLWEKRLGDYNQEGLSTYGGTTIRTIAFSPNGLLVAAGGVTNGGGGKPIMWLWDAITGKEIRRFSPNAHDVNSIAFSPDGRSIASGGRFGFIDVWNIQTGEEIRRYDKVDRMVWSVAFSPDDRYIASGSSASLGGVELLLWANPEEPADPSAALSTIQITIKGEPITIPFNQGLRSWIKLYGIGHHEPQNVPNFGWGTHGYSWNFHDRVFVAVGFTGQFDLATQINLFTKDAFTVSDITNIAKTLGFTQKQSGNPTRIWGEDPDHKLQALLWTGDKFRILGMGDPTGSKFIFTVIKTDQDQEVVTPGMESW